MLYKFYAMNISFYNDNESFLIIKKPSPITVNISNIEGLTKNSVPLKDDEVKELENNLMYTVKCLTKDVEIIFSDRFEYVNYTEKNENDEEVSYSYFILGYVFVNKIKINKEGTITKIPLTKTIDLEIEWQYNNSIGKISNKYKVLTNNVFKRLTLPLYYRPFYTNAVLLLTPTYMTESKGDYDIFELAKYWRETEKDEKGSNECYGRLFYSIANGCSMVENTSGNNKIYRLNDVSFSYIDKSEEKSGTMKINKPFRCYNEMEHIETGMTFADDIKITTQTSRAMKYGITEPFNINSDEVLNNVKCITNDVNSSSNTISLSISKVRNANKSDCVTTNKTWVNVYYKTGDSTGETINLKCTWTSNHRYVRGDDGSAKNDRFENTITITKTNTNGEDVILSGSTAARRTDATWVISKDNSEGWTLGDGYKDITWTLNYDIKNSNNGQATLTIKGEYIVETTQDITIKRQGIPIVNGDIDINVFSFKGRENVEMKYTINDEEESEVFTGFQNIYCSIKSDESNNNKYYNGKDIQILGKQNGEYEVFNTKNSLSFSLDITEGYPEGEEDNASKINVSYSGVKFYDDINLGENGLNVVGYSSKNVRYIALSEFEIFDILKSIYDFGYHEWGDNTPKIRYNGLNANDYIDTTKRTNSFTKYQGWKSIHTFLKTVNGTDVWLSGKYKGGNSSHKCIDITDKLNKVYEGTESEIWLDCGDNKRIYVIGIYDNYTCLSDEDYSDEKEIMYSIIKPHTSRFSIIKLYKL